MSEHMPQNIVLMTRAGRMIGVSIKGDGEGAHLARSVVASLAALCDTADEHLSVYARGYAVPQAAIGTAEAVPLTTWEMRWHPMGIPFGERSGR